jgi:hypothetical protein
MSKHDNPPAFPHTDYHDVGVYHGMTLRDYFAGQALLPVCNRGASSRECAEAAYQIADAMLAERAKEPKP